VVYKDETWNHVKHLDLILKNKRSNKEAHINNNQCINTKALFEYNEIIIKAQKNLNNWVYLSVERMLGEKYLLSFDIMLSTLFHEFQIAFRHYSIVDRYRFRVTDNLSLDFEVIGKGYFFHRVLSTPFLFILDRWYNIKLIICGGVYQFLVDNQIVMTVNDGVVW